MRPLLEISRSAFRANLAAVEARIAPSTLMLVTKDDAYGHGLAWSAETAADAGVRWFGSYDVHSAVRIRDVLDSRGRVFAWATSEDAEIAEAILHDVDLGVGTLEYLRRVVAVARRLGRPARVHLKVDTGLHRNGLRPEDWPAAVREARDAEKAGTILLVGVWSHIAEASDAEDDESQAVFLRAVDEVRATGPAPDAVHLTASAAAWWRPELRGSLSRVGAFCYGIRSADGPDLVGIRPIATLIASVEEVSDGRARIGIGSLDGLASTLVGAPAGSPAGTTTVREIALAHAVVDAWPSASVGDRVRLFGPGEAGEPSATDLAERIGTVGEEILTRLSPRVQRLLID